MTPEDRVRHTLTEADWSLPGWSDPKARIRRAIRRRHSIAGGATVVAVAALTIGIVLPLQAAGGPARIQVGPANSPNPRLTPQPTTHPDNSATPARGQGKYAFPAPGDPAFPSSIYPSPRTVPHGGYAACPSLAGVDPSPPPLAKSAYTGIITDYGHPSFHNDLRRADRSLWPEIRDRDKGGNGDQTTSRRISNRRGLQVVPAAQDPYISIAKRDCGQAIVDRSVALVVGPPQGAALQADIYVLSRRGHLLIWGLTPNIVYTGSLAQLVNQPRP